MASSLLSFPRTKARKPFLPYQQPGAIIEVPPLDESLYYLPGMHLFFDRELADVNGRVSTSNPQYYRHARLLFTSKQDELIG